VKRTIQVRIFRGEQKYVAECLDLPVVTEAAALDELAANIREAISLHLEGEDRPRGAGTLPAALPLLAAQAS